MTPVHLYIDFNSPKKERIQYLYLYYSEHSPYYFWATYDSQHTKVKCNNLQLKRNKKNVSRLVAFYFLSGIHIYKRVFLGSLQNANVFEQGAIKEI